MTMYSSPKVNSLSPSHAHPGFVSDSMKRIARGVSERIARRFRRERPPRPFSEFISFRETLAAAKAAGMSVGQYIEGRHSMGHVSSLDQTIEGLGESGLFNEPIDRICEIGPGSGRYLERIRGQLRPRRYEIYETSQEWRGWLVAQYGVTSRACDGRTLAETDSASVGLVHAHKVFSGLPFLTTVSYLREMARVVCDGGWVVFDILTEACLSGSHLDAWFKAAPWNWAWSPHITPRDYVVGFFAARGIVRVASFQVPLFPAVTECMVFRKLSREARGGSVSTED